jgi:hypothetical protein
MFIAVFALGPLVGSCGPRTPNSLRCTDLLPAEQAVFSRVAELFVTPSPTGCSNCHNTLAPVRGYNFEGPGVTYDSLLTKIDPIYVQLSTAAMPKDGVAWTDPQLQLVRSWYCYGASYDD